MGTKPITDCQNLAAMQKVKFSFRLVAKKSLANVFFFPDGNEESIFLKRGKNGKEWKNDEFELLVDLPFDYKLKVFGPHGTTWEAELGIIRSNEVIDFIKWWGKTGDTRRNISERHKPTKYLPDFYSPPPLRLG